VRSATTYFTDVPVEGDGYTLIQAFSIFKVINGTWIYVSDPKGGEYFAKASESVDLLAGDCDDHAILMAACIKAIGGDVRLVRTTGHIYPEMKVGDAKAMERAATLIRKELFPDQAGHAALFYHTDAKGERWINLDYTRNYPGGEVMNETIKGILPI
jgi:transglutaminase-like putative cysteine protease